MFDVKLSGASVFNLWGIQLFFCYDRRIHSLSTPLDAGAHNQQTTSNSCTAIRCILS